MASAYDSISLGGIFLRPSPFVDTSYEYAKSGRYTIGGVLLVTLSGTLVAKDLDCKDIITQMNTMRDYNNDHAKCYELIIGCGGVDTFLKGMGKIRSATVTKGDQPCIATYNLVIAIETENNGKPIINPDPAFLTRYPGIEAKDCVGVSRYEENISIQGDVSGLSMVDSDLNVSGAFIKMNGSIVVSSLSISGKICGSNDLSSTPAINLIKGRYKKLMEADFDSNSPYATLTDYNTWDKWLDTKDIEIDTANGTITWSFSLTMTKGGCRPMAIVQMTTTDTHNPVTERKTRSIQGTITGLSESTVDTFLANGIAKTRRRFNAEYVYDQLKSRMEAGSWPKQEPVDFGEYETLDLGDPGGLSVGGVKITSRGSGYHSGATVSIAPPRAGGTAATGRVLVNKAGAITGIVLTSTGSGYAKQELAVMTISDAPGATPAGSGASAVFTSVSDDDPCEQPAPSCYQRVSSSTTFAAVLGQISFSAEFADIDACAVAGSTSAVTFTIEEKLPAWNIVEMIIPGERYSVIQQIVVTPRTATVTVNGSLSGCDANKTGDVQACVDGLFNEKIKAYSGWIEVNKSSTFNSRSYSSTIEFMKCDETVATPPKLCG